MRSRPNPIKFLGSNVINKTCNRCGDIFYVFKECGVDLCDKCLLEEYVESKDMTETLTEWQAAGGFF